MVKQSIYIDDMLHATAKSHSIIGPTEDAAVVDKLVLSTINAPYKRDISTATLVECISNAKLAGWPVHVAAFFRDVSPSLILRFASVHGISKFELEHAYRVVTNETGERNPYLEAELVPMAASAR